MKAFKSWQSYSQYERALKYHGRYIRSVEIEAFLQTILETAKGRIETIPKNSFFWRAQLGHGWRHWNNDVGEVPNPHSPERMQPRLERATEGRANPKGIPYLYLASNRETALAEVRPWIGSHVSVGQFKTLQDLRIVNCTTENKEFKIYIYLKEPPPKKREEAVWADIDKAFAKPIIPSGDVADYVPTQVIAELFKANGFDGVAYRSSLGEGHNIALFDIRAAEIINCFLFEVGAIKFDFSEIASPYYISKHYKRNKG